MSEFLERLRAKGAAADREQAARQRAADNGAAMHPGPCPSCGAKVVETGHRYCKACGDEIPEESLVKRAERVSETSREALRVARRTTYGSAFEEITTKAARIREEVLKSGERLSQPAAIDRVCREDPDLYARYLAAPAVDVPRVAKTARGAARAEVLERLDEIAGTEGREPTEDDVRDLLANNPALGYSARGITKADRQRLDETFRRDPAAYRRYARSVTVGVRGGGDDAA
jgi:uncharacterized Zn finger protein (UPF0148 family)